MILLVLLILLALAAWYWRQHPGLVGTVRDLARSAASPGIAPGAAPAASAPLAVPTLPANPTRIPPVPGQTVSKCVFQGKTTYSDGPCPEGAKAAQLAVRPDANLIQAPAVAPAEPFQNHTAVRAPAPVAVPAPQPVIDITATCRDLERRIEELDAWARQPQPAPMQDWITARKREARDLQFRLKC